MLASLITEKHLAYPGSEDFYSPAESYPEYSYKSVSSRPNRVYAALRDCLSQAGLDASNFGTPSWNPLSRYIGRGSKVFVLCNFVYHRRSSETDQDFFAKCTHGSVLRAVIDYALIATGPNGGVCFGNAPLQSCSWEKVLQDTGADVVQQFYNDVSAPVRALDLRLVVRERGAAGNVRHVENRPEADGVIVTLGEGSFLEALYKEGSEPQFRVSDYDPDRTAHFHKAGRHVYVVHREILSSDVVLSIPKLKTHEKVGITVGLKGLVGCVGHKDCLAHHRAGSVADGGDEYPVGGYIRRVASRFHEVVHGDRFPAFSKPILEIVDRVIRHITRKYCGSVHAGAWHGNDTTWRMTLDLANIMHFSDKTGTMRHEVQRRHLVVIDAVAAGEGDGPLAPRFVPGETLAFCDNLVLGDELACKLMGYSSSFVPLVANAISDPSLGYAPGSEVTFFRNGKPEDFQKTSSMLGRPFRSPSGWSLLSQ